MAKPVGFALEVLFWRLSLNLEADLNRVSTSFADASDFFSVPVVPRLHFRCPVLLQ